MFSTCMTRGDVGGGGMDKIKRVLCPWAVLTVSQIKQKKNIAGTPCMLTLCPLCSLILCSAAFLTCGGCVLLQRRIGGSGGE